MDVTLRVDWILCDGYGLCGDLLPDLIDLDEWRYPILSPEPVERGRLSDAQRAIDCCPMKALKLESETVRRRPG
ncbi:MAG: ferredoxin [Thermomicrobiales bacterium]|jgi:ferredoxin|nr:MAG: ferredoxin [Thermomicrobiales bacterium]